MLKDIPVGTIYVGNEYDTQYETIRCRGCRKHLRLKTIYVVRVGRNGRYEDTPGFLPMELFDRAMDPLASTPRKAPEPPKCNTTAKSDLLRPSVLQRVAGGF